MDLPAISAEARNGEIIPAESLPVSNKGDRESRTEGREAVGHLELHRTRP